MNSGKSRHAHIIAETSSEYSLPGSYRRIINKPEQVSWTHLHYTDPDLALVQSDEDRLLNLNPPAEDDPEGKFRALKIELRLGSSAYATMALREVTREETSVWHQIGLTMRGEDQGYKGAGGAGEGEGDGDGEGGENEDGEEQEDHEEQGDQGDKDEIRGEV